MPCFILKLFRFRRSECHDGRGEISLLTSVMILSGTFNVELACIQIHYSGFAAISFCFSCKEELFTQPFPNKLRSSCRTSPMHFCHDSCARKCGGSVSSTKALPDRTCLSIGPVHLYKPAKIKK